jgi:tetratricopeptide (TPR) repeat protein
LATLGSDLQRKILLVTAGIFFLLFLAVSWFGWHSVQRQLLLMEARNHYDIAQRELRKHHYRKAGAYFNLAIKTWGKASRVPGFIPVENGGYDGYLTAGNSYLMVRRYPLARQCYEQALKYDPNAITVLSALGSCAYSLGDYESARKFLEKSNRICPLRKEFRAILDKLQAQERRKKRDKRKQ